MLRRFIDLEVCKYRCIISISTALCDQYLTVKWRESISATGYAQHIISMLEETTTLVAA